MQIITRFNGRLRLASLLAAAAITLLMLASTGLTTLQAQGAPDQIDSAFADLNQRLGTSYDTGTAGWRWSQQFFDDTALGCATATGTPVSGRISAYTFLITANGIEYDYRVSADETIVILCSETAVAEDDNSSTTPQVSADTYSNTLCALPAGQNTSPATDANDNTASDPNRIIYPRSRVQVDGLAITTQDSSRLRQNPGVDAAIIIEIPANAAFQIVAGPTCDPSRAVVWWQVDYDGTLGWTAESNDGEYLFAPQNPTSFVAPTSTISATNAFGMTVLGTLQGNIVPRIAWSPDGLSLAAAGNRGGEGIWVYDAGNFRATPRIVQLDDTIEDFSFAPDSRDVIAGTATGGTFVWDVRAGASLVERLFLRSFTTETSAVAVFPDGQYFAAGGSRAVTTRIPEEQRENAVIIWDLLNITQQAVLADAQSRVVDLAISPDGDQMAVADLNGTVYIYNTSDLTAPALQLSLPNLAASVLSYSNNGQFLAVGTSDGRAVLYDAAALLTATGTNAPTAVATYSVVGSIVRDVRFSPDSSLLYVADSDGMLRAYNTQDDSQVVSATVAAGVDLVQLAVSPDGRLVAVADDTSTITLLGIGSTPVVPQPTVTPGS